MDNDIQSYIDTHRKLGESDGAIQAQLLKAGWTAMQFAQYFPGPGTEVKSPSLFWWIFSWQVPLIIVYVVIQIVTSYKDGLSSSSSSTIWGGALFNIAPWIYVAIFALFIANSVVGYSISQKLAGKTLPLKLLRIGMALIVASPLVCTAILAVFWSSFYETNQFVIGIVPGLIVLCLGMLFVSLSLIFALLQKKQGGSDPNRGFIFRMGSWIFAIIIIVAVTPFAQGIAMHAAENKVQAEHNSAGISKYTPVVIQAEGYLAANKLDDATKLCLELWNLGDGSQVSQAIYQGHEQISQTCRELYLLNDAYSSAAGSLGRYSYLGASGISKDDAVNLQSKCSIITGSKYSQYYQDSKKVQTLSGCKAYLGTSQ